jgi:hypothetical protein
MRRPHTNRHHCPILAGSNCQLANGATVSGKLSMRKLTVMLAAIAVLTAPAYAQARGKGSKRPENSQQGEEKKKRDAAADKAYKDALHSVPEQKPSDPWAQVRAPAIVGQPGKSGSSR